MLHRFNVTHTCCSFPVLGHKIIYELNAQVPSSFSAVLKLVSLLSCQFWPWWVPGKLKTSLIFKMAISVFSRWFSSADSTQYQYSKWPSLYFGGDFSRQIQDSISTQNGHHLYFWGDFPRQIQDSIQNGHRCIFFGDTMRVLSSLCVNVTV